MRRPYTPAELAKIAKNEPSISQFIAITKDPSLPNNGGDYSFSVEGSKSGINGEPVLDFVLEALGKKLKMSYIFDNANRKEAYVEIQNTCASVARHFLSELLTQPVDIEGVQNLNN